MACGNCGEENKASAKFCAACGSPLARACPTCAASVRADQRFCDECGTSLTPEAAAPPAPASSPGSDTAAPVAERRVCSVLFCDLVGFTSLSEARDPEEVRELLSRYFEVARTVIVRYGGVVEKFIGDAVMAVWGTPTATEQDGERAVRAALELVEAVRVLGRESGAAELNARAGVVTGAVAVTFGATGEGMVAGDAVNTAARVQTAAQPGTVLVDEGTRRVAEAAVAFEAAGEHAMKGKSEPLPLWRAERVLSGVGGSQRIDGLEAGFVGRDAELRLVKELFHACAERRTPRLVSVTGAAGVGKSRLGWEFEKYVDGLADTVYWHRGRCLSYGDGVAFWALAEMVRQRFQIADEDAPAVAAEKLGTGLDRWLTDRDERAYVGPRLAQLLGTETAGDPTPQLGREELFAGWRLFFERLAGVSPVVMVVEDLQHADAGLLDFLEHLLDWARDVPVFVLTFARPELEARRAGWGTGRRNSTTLSLDPLDDAAMETLLDGLVPGMPPGAKAVIAGRAEGIPLYAVETVRMLIDRDIVQPLDGAYRLVGDVGQLAVPATLQSLLAARLDALDADARAVVADAAVLGGTFPAEALVAVSDQPEPQVRALLAELVRREVLGVRADPLSPQRGQYGFVQTMFRQVAYDTLSRRERKSRHLAVGTHLRTAFADDGEEVAEVIAAHLIDALHAVPDDDDVAQLRAEAVTMLSRAGERAARTGAPAAVTKAYATAAELLEPFDTPEAALQAAHLHERAAAAANTSADFACAQDHYEKAAEIYRSQQRLRDAARADSCTCAVLRRRGHLEESRAYVTAALAVLAEEPDEDTVAALAELATVEAFTGNAIEADQGSAAALSEAQALDLSDTLFAELFIIRGIAHSMANRPMQSAANLREAVRRAEAHSDSTAAARALLNLGDALISIDPAEAAEAAHAAVVHCRRIGYRHAMGFATANLLQALLLTGDWTRAREAHRAAVDADDLGWDHATAQSAALLYAFAGDQDNLALAFATAGMWDDTEDPQDRGAAATARAAAAASRGDQAQALELAQEALAQGEMLSLRNDAVRWAWPVAADAALAVGDEAAVERLLDRLSRRRPGHIPQVLRAESQRIRARLLATRADPQAGAAFEGATKALRELGSPYHLAIGLLDHADYLATADGDAKTAHQLASEAETIALELGATPLLERARGLLPAVSRAVEAPAAVGV